MADELKVRASVVFSKGGAKYRRNISKSITVSGDAFLHNVQSVGTTEELLEGHADMTAVGVVLLINLDATNYVEFGSTTGVYDLKLKAGEFALYRHNSNFIYAKANTAAVLCEYFVAEN